MYAEYANEISEEDLLYEPSERTSDIQLPPVLNILLLGGWLVICLVGFMIIFFAKNIVLGIAVIGILTFLGMVIKPTFALCLMMLVLPTGAGVGYGEVFSLERGVGIALAVSFLLNLLVSRPSLHIHNKALWVSVIFTIWVFFASLAAPYASLELGRAFTYFQLLTLVFTVYWILQTNGEKTFRWALRAYVIGTLGTIIIAHISGAAMIAMEEAGQGRYAGTLGHAIDANMLAALTGLAFLAAIYLFARDRNILWRIVHLTAILFLPLMMLRIASRGALIALVFTMLSPLLFMKQALRRPALAALLLLVIVFASGSAAFLVHKYSLEKGVSKRLTDVSYAETSVSYRISLIKKAIEVAVKYPAGTSYLGWFERTGITTAPHNDFAFALGIYGIPCAVIFAFFIIIMMLTIKRMPLGLEKLYARAALTFLLVMGLDIGQLGLKYFWIFMAIIMAAERISWFHISKNEYELVESDEETADINY